MKVNGLLQLRPKRAIHMIFHHAVHSGTWDPGMLIHVQAIVIRDIRF